jgi:hypothetical protein
MDTGELAEEAVNSHNARLAAERAERAAERHATRLHNVTGVQFGSGNSQTNVF